MQAYMLYDNEFNTLSFQTLHDQVMHYLQSKGFNIIERGIGKGDLDYCMGCFGCWIKKPGECVIPDTMADINRDYIQSDVVACLCPVVFGQFSANIKNALDRWIPNVLPFFGKRPDGSTTHPGRYESYPKQIMIGYADDATDEDIQLFHDITRKHRREVDTLWYHHGDDLSHDLSSITLQRVGVAL